MFLKMLLVAAVIAAGMGAVKDGRTLERTGLVGSCASVEVPAGDGSWEACRPGKLEGRPDLRRKSCVSAGLRGDVEYWRCPSRIGSGPNA